MNVYTHYTHTHVSVYILQTRQSRDHHGASRHVTHHITTHSITPKQKKHTTNIHMHTHTTNIHTYIFSDETETRMATHGAARHVTHDITTHSITPKKNKNTFDV